MTGIVMLFAFTSCTEGNVGSGNETRNSGSDLQAVTTFDWSTTQQVTIEIEKLEVPVLISRKLTLSTEEGADFYTGSQLMNENFSLSIELPNHVKSVSMKYGDIEKIQEIQDSKVRFNYVTPSEDIGYVD
jgi:hypothetical protein